MDWQHRPGAQPNDVKHTAASCPVAGWLSHTMRMSLSCISSTQRLQLWSRKDNNCYFSSAEEWLDPAGLVMVMIYVPDRVLTAVPRAATMHS
jgi:hypothetical protein